MWERCPYRLKAEKQPMYVQRGQAAVPEIGISLCRETPSCKPGRVEIGRSIREVLESVGGGDKQMIALQTRNVAPVVNT